MKKYKLIKQYPTSPKLGFTVFERHCGMYHNIETGNMYGSQIIENQPEFWEEVVEKDYEIVSQTPSVRVCNPKDNYKVVRNTTPVIHSVKRLSDGEVFTVGDTVRMYEHGPIKTIETITTNSIRSSIKQGVWFTYNSGSSHMDHAIKQNSNQAKQEDMITKIMQMDAKMAYDSLPKQELSTKLHIGEVVDDSYPKEFINKQETLEEVALKQAQLSYYGDEVDAYVRGSVFGAKWEQQKIYSEEDMRQAFEWGVAHITFEEWIKKFKKK